MGIKIENSYHGEEDSVNYELEEDIISAICRVARLFTKNTRYHIKAEGDAFYFNLASDENDFFEDTKFDILDEERDALRVDYDVLLFGDDEVTIEPSGFTVKIITCEKGGGKEPGTNLNGILIRYICEQLVKVLNEEDDIPHYSMEWNGLDMTDPMNRK